MSDCCGSSSSSGTGFPNAASMEQNATNNAIVWAEICAIQQAIMAAASQCQPGGGRMCTTIGGLTPMTFVSGVTKVDVLNPGAGYVQDVPSIKFIPPLNSSALGATGTILTNGGNILEVDIVTPGSGYQPIPATAVVSSITGTTAVIEPLVDAAGRIVSINIINAGTGYTTSDSIIASRAVAPSALYVTATFQIASVSLTGEILSIIVTNPGSGYQPSVATVQIVSTLNPLMPYPLGTGFMADVLTDALGAVIKVVISNTGYGYATMSPYMVITDPGMGATTQVNLVADTVGSVTVLTPGTNYTQAAIGTVFNPVTVVGQNPPALPAQVVINVNNNTYGTDPMLYWQVWAGVVTNKPISVQLNAVLTYFKGLGYTISIVSNPATGKTIMWNVCW